jgi:hypothetical protein
VALAIRGVDVIATDSLAAIYQIWKALTRPQDIGEHRHATLLREIAAAISRRGPGRPPLRLIKVQGHSGITGNERADEIATDVAKGVRDDNTRTHVQNYRLPPSNDMEDQFWPYKRTVVEEAQEAQAQPSAPAATGSKRGREPEAAVRWRPIANLAEALKSLAKDTHAMTGADKTGHYYTCWAKGAGQRHKASAHHMAARHSVTWAAQRTTLQFLTGQLSTQ